jgi:tetratricopeptide (TPR) repeat protein/predicted AlkP superfamily phosphohydrolase/phosphomutase
MPRLPVCALVTAALLCGAVAGQRPAAPRVLLIALDGADWQAIDPLIAAGRARAFAAIRREGRTGIMQSTPPLVSPIIWTTIATGRRPEDHGVLDFMVDLPSGEQAPVGTASRRVAAIWNIVSNAARSVSVVGWWATWPAEQLRGTIVSDRVAPQLIPRTQALGDESVAPREAASALLRFVTTTDRITRADIERFVPMTAAEYDAARRAASAPTTMYRDRQAHLAAVIAGTRTYEAIAQHLLGSQQPDLLAVYFEEIDTISHLFVNDARHGANAIARAYEDADGIVATLAAAAAPDTLVVVCSDHGFYRATAGIRENPADLAGPATAWHRPYGIIATIEAGRLAKSVRQGPDGNRSTAAPTPSTIVSPLDVTPTVLHALGLPVSREMPGRVVEALLPDAAHGRGRAVASVATYESGERKPPAAGGKVDPAARARLQALGYIGAVSSSLAGQNLGEVLYRAGRLDAAERQLVAVTERQPTNVAALLWLAKTRRDLGRAQQALAIYERVLRLDPNAGDALLEAVDVAIAAGTIDRAKAMVAMRERKRAGDVWSRTAAGTVAAAERRPADAEREFRGALAADPFAYEPLSRLVDLLAAAGRGRDAAAIVRGAAARVPDSPRHAALLGEALLAARDPAGAESAFERALLLAPDSATVRLELARAQIARRRPMNAIDTLAPVPASAGRSRLLGAAYSALGRWVEAAAEFRQALAEGGSVEVLNGLGWAEYKQGRRSQAVEAFQRSLALQPDQPQIRELVSTLKTSKTPGSS